MTATIRGTVASVLPTLEPTLEPPFMRIDLDAVRAVVREEVRAALTDNAALRQASEQALEALESDPVPLNAINNACAFLRAALKEKA